MRFSSSSSVCKDCSRPRTVQSLVGLLFSAFLLGAVAPAQSAERFGPALSEEAARPIAPSRFQGIPASGLQTRKGSVTDFTMGQAVRQALAFRPSLAASEAQAKSSEEGRKSARGSLGPKLGTTYSYYKQARATSVQNASSPPAAGTYTWTIEVSQILFSGFSVLGTYQKQALQAESDRASLRQTELDAVTGTQEAFISYLASVENCRSQKEAAARLRDQLTITRAYHDAGLKPKLDVLQAEVDLGKAEQTLISAENTRETTRAKLNTLLGLPVERDVRYVGALTVRSFPLSLDQCLERAYRLRPDLYVGYKAVEIAVKERLIARSGYYPKVEAYYNITKTGNTPDLERGGSNSTRSTTWEAGAKLTWDVFQWGTTYFADQQAGWLVRKMRSQVQELTLSAGYDVKEKFLALREAEQRIRVARQSVASAREAYNAALGQYQAQVGTNFDVLNASSKLLTAEADLTGARGDYLTAVSRLYAAMGEYHPDLL